MARHPRAPWRDVAFVGAYWNCAERLENLLPYVRPWFKTISVVVQESPDNTLEVAKKYADVVNESKWLGRGDPSFNKAIQSSGRPWSFLISDDEWPTEELLNSFQDLITRLNIEKKDGAWVHFKSSIDGLDFTREQDEHLRIFRSFISWPSSQHARPNTNNTIKWRPDGGFVRHDRSLNEMMTDYVRRYEIGLKENASSGQMEHNKRMMRAACGGVAGTKGWSGIVQNEWWNSVVKYAYDGKPPEIPVEEPPAQEVAQEPTEEPVTEVEQPTWKPRARRSRPSK